MEERFGWPKGPEGSDECELEERCAAGDFRSAGFTASRAPNIRPDSPAGSINGAGSAGIAQSTICHFTDDKRPKTADIITTIWGLL